MRDGRGGGARAGRPGARRAPASRTPGRCWPRCRGWTRRAPGAAPGPRPAERAAAAGAAAPDEPLLEAVGCARSSARRQTRSPPSTACRSPCAPGETLGVVGESGSGKTTLGRMLRRLLEPDRPADPLRRHGHRRLSDRRCGRCRRELQMVFQDPVSSLNPRRTRRRVHRRPAARARASWTRRAVRARVAGTAGAGRARPPTRYDRYPHEFSGGQRQRVGIARALAAAAPAASSATSRSPRSTSPRRPRWSPCWPSCSGELGLALVFIAHDLAVVRQVSDRVAVMRRGPDRGAGHRRTRSTTRPQDPYTRQLLAAVPALDPALAAERRRGTAPPEPYRSGP